jgi:hypothetical protein
LFYFSGSLLAFFLSGLRVFRAVTDPSDAEEDDDDELEELDDEDEDELKTLNFCLCFNDLPRFSPTSVFFATFRFAFFAIIFFLPFWSS